MPSPSQPFNLKYWHPTSDPRATPFYTQNISFKHITDLLLKYSNGFGWRSHRERCWALIQLSVYLFSEHIELALERAVLHQLHLMSPQQYMFSNQDKQHINTLYEKAAKANPSFHPEALLRVPKKSNLDEHKATSYYSTLLKVKVICFEINSTLSTTHYQSHCFNQLVQALLSGNEKFVISALQTWCNLFFIRGKTGFERLQPLDTGDTSEIYRRLSIPHHQAVKAQQAQIEALVEKIRQLLDQPGSINQASIILSNNMHDEEDYRTYLSVRLADIVKHLTATHADLPNTSSTQTTEAIAAQHVTFTPYTAQPSQFSPVDPRQNAQDRTLENNVIYNKMLDILSSDTTELNWEAYRARRETLMQLMTYLFKTHQDWDLDAVLSQQLQLIDPTRYPLSRQQQQKVQALYLEAAKAEPSIRIKLLQQAAGYRNATDHTLSNTYFAALLRLKALWFDQNCQAPNSHHTKQCFTELVNALFAANEALIISTLQNWGNVFLIRAAKKPDPLMPILDGSDIATIYERLVMSYQPKARSQKLQLEQTVNHIIALLDQRGSVNQTIMILNKNVPKEEDYRAYLAQRLMDIFLFLTTSRVFDPTQIKYML